MNKKLLSLLGMARRAGRLSMGFDAASESMKKGQSNRLTTQQKEGQGPITIFHKDAQIHDKDVGNTSQFVIKQLEYEFPM